MADDNGRTLLATVETGDDGGRSPADTAETEMAGLRSPGADDPDQPETAAQDVWWGRMAVQQGTSSNSATATI